MISRRRPISPMHREGLGQHVGQQHSGNGSRHDRGRLRARAIPCIADLPAALLVPDSNANPPVQCRFDFASVIDIVPPSESWNGSAGARWQFRPTTRRSWRPRGTQAKVPSAFPDADFRGDDPRRVFRYDFAELAVLPATPTADPRRRRCSRSIAYWRGLDFGPEPTSTRSSRRASSADCWACWRAGTTPST